MHICFITSEFPKEGFPHGGVGTFVSTLGKSLVEKGIQVSVIGLNYINKEETEKINGINVYRVIAKKQKGLQWYFNAKAISRKIKEVHAKNPIDIVETAELGLAFMPKIKNIKYIIRLHGGHHFFAEGEKRGINWWKGYQEKRSFKKADAFIGVSNYVKNHTSNYLSYHNKTVEVINLPISFEKFLPENNLKFEENTIVFAGTVCEKKGVRQLIQAFQLVKKEYDDCKLYFYGRDWLFPDGKLYTAYLKEEFNQIELENVIFKGVVSHDELPKIYQNAQVCVFPSHIETQGLVAPEAMAMEKMVIFSETGPGIETIIPNETGLLCNPHDPKDIAEKIKWVFNNPEESIKIGKQAREFALNKFNIQQIVEKNIKFYHQIISN
jgi:glycosyltransferase involved in cell wall biosynthesis